MRVLAILLGSMAASFATADVVGQWQGIATLGPSQVAQGMDGDGLIKLQISKAFLKTLNYSFDIKADKSFVSVVTGEDMPRRSGKGTWSMTGNILTLLITEENGAKRNQALKATISPDGKKMIISIDSKPGLPPTKLVFKKFEPRPVTTTKSGSAKNIRH
jgi:hypothetical protein